MEPNSHLASRQLPYVNGVLTVLAALLALDIGVRVMAPGQAVVGGAPAMAQDEPQPSEGVGLVSAADQRKQMLVEMRRMAKQLDAIRAKLDAGLSVKVTDMPELKLPKEKAAG